MHIHVYDAEAALIFSLINVTTLPSLNSLSSLFSQKICAVFSKYISLLVDNDVSC